MKASNIQQEDDPGAFYLAMAGAIGIGLLALLLGGVLQTPPFERFAWTAEALASGVLATAPMLALLIWFMRTEIKSLAAFRNSQIDFFAQIGFRFTPLRIALMAAGAGIAEETFFRGFLQDWIAGVGGLVPALIISNAVFGILHMRTILYAVIAGAVGVYLGVIYALSDNLLAPIVAHALYDVFALELTRRAIARHQRTDPA